MAFSSERREVNETIRTVLDAGRGLQDAKSCVTDAQRLFSQLAADGIRDEQPSVLLYDELCGGDEAACVRQLVSLVFKDVRQGAFDTRLNLYLALLNGTDISPDYRMSFIRRDPSLALIFDDILSIWHLTRAPLHGRTILRPTIILPPVEFRKAIDPADAMGGNGVFLCPDRYYYQILWHELMHEIFRLDDCYTSVSEHCPDEPDCIMQWEPINSDPERGNWLCSRQRRCITTFVSLPP